MEFDALLGAGLVEADVSLEPFTTYRRGGNAKWYYPATTTEALQVVVPTEIPVLVLGRGSNLVVASDGFPGLVIHVLSTSAEVRTDGLDVEAPGGCPLPQLARRAAEDSIGGLSFFVGIPGSVGGAVRMNAGCHGSEMKDVLGSAAVWHLRRGSLVRRSPTDLDMAYRHSNLTDDEVVLSARLCGQPSTRETEEAAMREVSRWRRRHQPGGTLNAGSVFRNPEGDAAGRLIDSLGLKGLRRGGATVSQRHANFIEADPDATPEDVHDLMRAVQAIVAERSGIRLEPEIRFVGFDQ